MFPFCLYLRSRRFDRFSACAKREKRGSRTQPFGALLKWLTNMPKPRLYYPVFHRQTRNVAKIRIVVGRENGVAADCMGGDHPIVIAPARPTALGNDPAIGQGG